MKIETLHILSVAAVASFFIPLVIVLLRRLGHDPFFGLFATFWALSGLINLTDVVPGFSLEVRQKISTLYNLLDVPVILAIFYHTSTSIIVRKFALAAIAVILSIELASVFMYGVTEDANKYSLGPGIALVLAVVVWEIVRYLNKVQHSNRQNATILVYAALLFEYAIFIVIYIFDFFVNGSDSRDTYLIYYISSLIALMIASAGFLIFRTYEKA